MVAFQLSKKVTSIETKSFIDGGVITFIPILSRRITHKDKFEGERIQLTSS
jgi:hypothetical protein